MADTKISDLPAASAANDTDQLPANQAGTTRRLTVAQIVARVTALAWSGITGTPTTLSGYGITDAASASDLTTHASDTTSVHGITDTADLIVEGDSRLTDSRAPTGAAGGVLSGTYPDPTFAADMATQAELDAHTSAIDNPHSVTAAQVGAYSTSAADTLLAAKAAASDLTAHTSATTSVHGIADTGALLTSAAAAAAYQPLDSDLTAIAALTTTAYGRSLLTSATAAAARSTIDLGTSHPADHNLIAWAFDPSCMQGGIAPTGGQVVLIRLVVPQATNVTTIWLDFQAAGSGLTTDQNWAGLYDTSGALLGATLDQTTNWSSLGIRECTLNTAPVAVAAGYVYVAILSNGTTRPTIRRGLNTQGVNIGLSAPNLRYATGPSSQTTLPSSITMASTSAYSNAVWAAIA